MSDDKLNELLVKCFRDAETRKRFVANPTKVLGEHGIELPPTIDVVVVEDTATKIHVVLPPAAAKRPAAELSDAQLDAVSGGAGTVQPSAAQTANVTNLSKLRLSAVVTSSSYSTCDMSSPCAALSGRDHKKDIGYLSRDEEQRLADELMSFRLATYRYKTEGESAPRHLGFIIDDVAPSAAIANDGEHVDLYAYTTMAVAALQTHQQQILALQKQVDELKRELLARPGG